MGFIINRIIVSFALALLIYVPPEINPDYPYYEFTYNEEIVNKRFEPAYNWLVLIGLKVGFTYREFYLVLILLEVLLINLILKNLNSFWVLATLATWIFILPTFGIQIRWGISVLIAILSIVNKNWFMRITLALSAVLFHKFSVVIILLHLFVFVAQVLLRNDQKLFWAYSGMIAITMYIVRGNVDFLIEVFGYTDYHGSDEFLSKSLVSLVYILVVATGFLWFAIKDPILMKSNQFAFWGACIAVAVLFKDFAVVSGRVLVFTIIYETVLLNTTEKVIIGNNFRFALVGLSVARLIALKVKQFIEIY